MASMGHDRTGPEVLTDGERWTRAALAELQARRYAPTGWVRFIVASAERSLEDLRRRPALAREAVAVVGAGAAPWILLGRGRALAWWGVVGAMLMTHVGMVEGPSGERRAGLGAANLLTLGRAWLIPLVLMSPRRGTFTALSLLAFASDALDGPVARRRDEVTRLGAQMDHAVDVALSVAVAESARRRGLLSGPVSAMVAIRYVAPIALLGAYYFWRAEPPRRERLAPARSAGVVVAAGLVVAAGGQRRVSERLVIIGAAWGAGRAVTSAIRAIAGTRGEPASGGTAASSPSSVARG